MARTACKRLNRKLLLQYVILPFPGGLPWPSPLRETNICPYPDIALEGAATLQNLSFSAIKWSFLAGAAAKSARLQALLHLDPAGRTSRSNVLMEAWALRTPCLFYWSRTLTGWLASLCEQACLLVALSCLMINALTLECSR